eukprot:10205898-Alexandrium_andersonii.AAC.1
MSASLVGSEMCIRDRPPTAFHASLSCARSARPQPSPGRSCACSSPRGCCLLYTSDAADDM